MTTLHNHYNPSPHHHHQSRLPSKFLTLPHDLMVRTNGGNWSHMVHHEIMTYFCPMLEHKIDKLSKPFTLDLYDDDPVLVMCLMEFMYERDYTCLASFRQYPVDTCQARLQIDLYGLALKYNVQPLLQHTHSWMTGIWAKAWTSHHRVHEIMGSIAPICALGLKDLKHPLISDFMVFVVGMVWDSPELRARLYQLEAEVPLFGRYMSARMEAAMVPDNVVTAPGPMSGETIARLMDAANRRN